jgi:hypothetical protein
VARLSHSSRVMSASWRTNAATFDLALRDHHVALWHLSPKLNCPARGETVPIVPRDVHLRRTNAATFDPASRDHDVALWHLSHVRDQSSVTSD